MAAPLQCGQTWAQWQSAGNTNQTPNRNYKDQFVDENGASVQTTAADADSFINLGYTYDLLTTPSITAPPMTPGLMFNNVIATPQAFTFNQLEKDGVVRLIGRANNTQRSHPNVETRISLKQMDLMTNLNKERKIKLFDLKEMKPLTIQKPSRILAEVGILGEKNASENLITNVWVNCNYLTPDLEVTDKHFAGSFSLFGMSMDGRKVLLDLTDTLSRLASDAALSNHIDLQLMPIKVDDSAKADGSYVAENVTLFRV